MRNHIITSEEFKDFSVTSTIASQNNALINKRLDVQTFPHFNQILYVVSRDRKQILSIPNFLEAINTYNSL